MSALILVVEDDAPIRESLCDLLIDEGYRVAEAANGAEALRELDKETPALILLDLWMPVMTGGQLYHELKASPRWSAIPVVVVTAANDPPPAEELEVLRKPVSLEDLLAAVARHV